MIIKTLKLNNFFSFNDAKIDFTKYQSPILVKGFIGRDELSNGAGKSSLFEAIYWCLTGRTVRGSQAKDVITFGKKHCQVALSFMFNNKLINVDRYYSNSKKYVVINIDDEVHKFHSSSDATKFLFEFLGFNQDIFSLLSFYGRSFNVFSYLKPREKADVISLLSFSNVYDKAELTAKRKYKEYLAMSENLLAKQEEITNELTNITNLLNTKMHELMEHKDLINATKADIKNDINVKQLKINEYKSYKDKIKDVNLTIKDLITTSSNLQSLEKQLAKEQIKLDGLNLKYKQTIQETKELIIFQQEKSNIKNQITSLNNECKDVVGQIKKLEQEINKLYTGLDSNICPLCKQELKQSKSNIINKIKDLETNKSDIHSTYLIIEDKMLEQTAKQTKVDKQIIEEQTNIHKLNIEIDKYNKIQESELDSIKQSVKSITASINDEKDNINKANKQIQKDNQEKKKLIDLIAEADKNINTLQLHIEKQKGLLKELDNDAKTIELQTIINQNIDFTKKMETQKKELTIENDKVCKDMEIYKYWEKGFKNIRFNSFDTILKIFKNLLNNYLTQVELDFTDVVVDNTATRTTGREVPEINLYIKREDYSVNINSLSEGERQRVDLACYFALSTLIQEIFCGDSAFSILDEPLSALDNNGKQSAFDLINAVNKQQLFIIDHANNFQDLFNSVIQINKEDGVSTIN